MLLGSLSGFGRKNRLHQTKTAFDSIEKICQRNRLVEDRYPAGASQLIDR